ncbi:MAG: hypothetical protein ACLQG3_12425 [Terracidiphilus sp.]
MQSVTVEQLKQMLAAQQTAGKNDGDRAQQLNLLELTEQLTQPTLDRITAEFKPGPKTVLSLKLLADSSAFLEPPAGELLDKAPPTAADQRAMMKSAINFVGVTLRHMPDFLATRLTDSYDNSPLSVTHSGWAPHTDLHPAGTFSHHIVYRDGQEVLDRQPNSSGAKPKNEPTPVGLVSIGEFGSALGVIISDASKGILKWSHWEQNAAGPVAVYHYEVPPAASHYWVNYCCVRSSSNDAGEAFGVNAGLDQSANSYHGTPSYHGNLYLDPATGAVLRVTIESDLKPSDPIMRAAISVQYGPVEIGGKSYVCPVHSIAISLTKSHARGDMSDMEIQRINEVSFTDYHRFGSTSQIITDGPAQ